MNPSASESAAAAASSTNKRSRAELVDELDASAIKRARGANCKASIGSLALAELQIVLQFLTACERVTVAACCKDMLSACRHAVPWRYDPFCLETTMTDGPAAYSSPFSLALFAKKKVVVKPKWRMSSAGIRPEEAAEIASIPNLSALEARHVMADEIALVIRPALALPGCASIVDLTLHSTRDFSERDIAALIAAHLPRLTTLKLDMTHFSFVEPHGCLRFANIGSLVHLTDLTVCGQYDASELSASVPDDALLRLPNLQSLELQTWSFLRGHVRLWAANSTGMHSLRHLSLHFVEIKEAADEDRFTSFTMADYTDLLSASPLIETLMLQCVDHLNGCMVRAASLVAVLKTLPRLHTLIVCNAFDYNVFSYPSQACIDLLLAECPELHVDIYFLEPEFQFYSDDEIQGEYAEQYAARNALTQLGGRVTESFREDDEE